MILGDYEKMDQKEKHSFLAEICNCYYELNMTQTEIANKFSTTRFKISKFLNEAKELGIVKITIEKPFQRVSKLENELKEKFGLKEAIIVNNNMLPNEDNIYILGKITASYLENILNERSIVGVTWGRSVFNLVKNIYPKRKIPLTVVQMVGSAAKDNPVIDSQELIRRFANSYSGKAKFIYAPLYIYNDYARKSLMQEPIINDTLFLSNKADVVITGIGTTDAIFASSLWSQYLTEDIVKISKGSSAVGCILGYAYDKNGKILDINLNKSVVGVDLGVLNHANYSIGIAVGKYKAESILAAIRGKFINVLATDDATASKILNLSDLNL